MKPQNRKTAILILAAGASRRLGRPKQLLKLEGQTLLRRMTELAVSLDIGPVFVVLGAQVELMESELDRLEVYQVENPNWAKGMATSLQVGISFVETLEPDVEAVLVLLVDQPKVDADLLAKLINTFQEKRPPLVASFYNNRNGVPAIFDRSLFKELKSVEGDRGARRVIRKYEATLVSIPFPGGVMDVDTEEDYLIIKNLE